MSNEKVKVTSLAEMKDIAQPIVPIPAWDNENEIHVRLRRVTLLSIIQSGQIPNDLLGVAQKVALKRQGTPESPIKQDDPDEVSRFHQLLDEVAKQALVEPTYDEIVEHVAPLTDQQRLAIFTFATSGVKALTSFRRKTGTDASGGNGGEDVRGETK